MTIHLEKSVYDDCQRDIEIAFDTIFPPNSSGKCSTSMQRSLAWLYGGLHMVFVWDNLAITGIDRNEYGYYIHCLQNTITRLTLLSKNVLESPESQCAYLNCANTLQNTLHRLTSLNNAGSTRF